MSSSKFSRRHAALLASRSSPARRCAREDCDLESTPKRRKTFSSSFRPCVFGLVGRRAVFRFAPITRCETRTKSDAGRAGQRRLERERTRCETLAGTHNAREHAIRRGHDGAIRRFERRIRAHARRASRVASRVARGGRGSAGTRRAGDCREPGAARHLPVAARVRRSARRARTTQKARHARAAPRARRRSARPRRRSARSRHEKERGVVPAPTLARDARERGRRAPKHEREERDGKVSLRRERLTCGVGAGARTVCLSK